MPAKITLKDAQGGFVGFSGWITTVDVDGTWTRSQFINQNVRPTTQRGQLSATQARHIKSRLTTAQVEKLPARLGKFRGANPHVYTLTVGEKQITLTLPTGAKLEKPQPGGKLADADAFALVAAELMNLKPGPLAVDKPKDGKPTFDEWVKGGMKIPGDRVFIGGTPWFDERRGERRTPREVYEILFGKRNR